jgi:glycosyltransferase involved in cell wall biosynthesis
MAASISFLIPTLNSANVLEKCLASIAQQKYPKQNIHIVIADGGSTDTTLDIATSFNATILANPLRTAEAGKMVALKSIDTDFVALVDSDNFLPDENWIAQMLTPLNKHPDAVLSEPWAYLRRNEDGVITRYCAMIGMNDPLCLFLGNYDRFSLLTGKWTEIPHSETDHGDYLLVTLDKRGLPTVGANGTVFRTQFLKANVTGDYLFDIDVLAGYINTQGSVNIVKVKNGIIHSYCESNFIKFRKKQQRRVNDYYYYRSLSQRQYDWKQNSFKGYVKFIVYTVLVFPLVVQALRGKKVKEDVAWFFHIPACIITLMEYGLGFVRGHINPQSFSRKNWKQ